MKKHLENVLTVVRHSVVCYQKTRKALKHKCISTKQFMKQNNITDGIDKWLSDNKDYLDKYTAVYKCLIFSFSDGAVSNIESYEKNITRKNRASISTCTVASYLNYCGLIIPPLVYMVLSFAKISDFEGKLAL